MTVNTRAVAIDIALSHPDGSETPDYAFLRIGTMQPEVLGRWIARELERARLETGEHISLIVTIS